MSQADPMGFSLISDIFKAVADSVAKLADGIAHAVTLGAKGYDAVQSRRLAGRLESVMRDVVDLSASQSGYRSDLSGFVRSLRDAGVGVDTDDQAMLDKEWRDLKEGFERLPEKVDALLVDLRKENSAFVTDDAYRALLSALVARKKVYESVSMHEVTPNITDLPALEATLAEWRRLVDGLRFAEDALSAYLSEGSKLDSSLRWTSQRTFAEFVKTFGRPPTTDDYATGRWASWQSTLPTARNNLGTHNIIAVCASCSHEINVDLDALIAEGKGDAPLSKLLLKCGRCGKTQVQTLSYLPL